MMTPSYVKGDRTGVRLLAISLLFLALASEGYGQQVTGKLGSADATTTIDGKQIPSQPPKFGGVIKGRLLTASKFHRNRQNSVG